ncbi:hypothetical protein C8R45DRAFT_942458 [Mycena sanguinolenta]|nr:hypothetical protein C8R45DRAFT_942458 [Mycena sanguinolenta]
MFAHDRNIRVPGVEPRLPPASLPSSFSRLRAECERRKIREKEYGKPGLSGNRTDRPQSDSGVVGWKMTERERHHYCEVASAPSASNERCKRDSHKLDHLQKSTASKKDVEFEAESTKLKRKAVQPSHSDVESRTRPLPELKPLGTEYQSGSGTTSSDVTSLAWWLGIWRHVDLVAGYGSWFCPGRSQKGNIEAKLNRIPEACPTRIPGVEPGRSQSLKQYGWKITERERHHVIRGIFPRSVNSRRRKGNGLSDVNWTKTQKNLLIDKKKRKKKAWEENAGVEPSLLSLSLTLSLEERKSEECPLKLLATVASSIIPVFQSLAPSASNANEKQDGELKELELLNSTPSRN